MLSKVCPNAGQQDDIVPLFAVVELDTITTAETFLERAALEPTLLYLSKARALKAIEKLSSISCRSGKRRWGLLVLIFERRHLGLFQVHEEAGRVRILPECDVGSVIKSAQRIYLEEQPKCLSGACVAFFSALAGKDSGSPAAKPGRTEIGGWTAAHRAIQRDPAFFGSLRLHLNRGSAIAALKDLYYAAGSAGAAGGFLPEGHDVAVVTILTPVWAIEGLPESFSSHGWQPPATTTDRMMANSVLLMDVLLPEKR